MTRSPLGSSKQVKTAIPNELRGWSYWMRRRKNVTVIMEHNTATTASRSVIEMMNNTEEMAKLRRSELKCP